MYWTATDDMDKLLTCADYPDNSYLQLVYNNVMDLHL